MTSGILLFFNRLTITPTQNLIHRCIIITRRNAGNVVAAILCAQRAIGIKDHARGYRLFTHRMADVEAFHTLHRR